MGCVRYSLFYSFIRNRFGRKIQMGSTNYSWITIRVSLINSFKSKEKKSCWSRSKIFFIYIHIDFYLLSNRLTFTLLILASVPMITLLSRLIILAIFVPLSLLLSLLPKTRPHFTNFATSLIGAYFLLLGIDLFVRLGFSDLISGLVSDEGVKIDGTTEWIWVQGRNGEWKGLVAVWYILTILGTFVQIYTGGVNSGEDDEVRRISILIPSLFVQTFLSMLLLTFALTSPLMTSMQ